MSSTSRELLHVLVEHLSPVLSGYGFKYLKSKECFEKKSKECLEIIIPYFDIRNVKGVYNLGFRFSVRINKLEDVINSCKPYKSKKSAKQTVSATELLLNLTERNSSEWNYSNREEVIDDLDIIINEIEKHGLEFLKKYCHVEKLMHCLENHDYDCPVSTFEARAETQLATYVCMGEVEKFNEILPVLRESMSKKQDGFFKERFDDYVNTLQRQYPKFN